VLTNDPTPPSDELIGVEIDDYSQILTSSVILPGTKIGKNCLVAANSTVSGIYIDDRFISGSPARDIGTLSKMPFFNGRGQRHYPWQYNFKRGMPWENDGYVNWQKTNKK
jgi:carbonic anhydrase/acetyltransferase-like protein (isoleucine patch superfamily)